MTQTLGNHRGVTLLTRARRFVVRGSVATAAVATFFVGTQDFQIFPGLVTSLLTTPEAAPDPTEGMIVDTQDGERISVWRVDATLNKKKQVALLFHGNAETLTTFFHVQRWFASLGYTNYAVDYRGYGASSGFPSEQGLYLDGEASMKLLLEKEGISPQDVIVFGVSIGTGPAAYIAQKFGVGILVLVAPYTSLSDLVREYAFLGYLHPFLKYRFPTNAYVGMLKDTCVVAAHGKNDTTIPYHHSLELKKQYKGSRDYTLIQSESAGHNDTLSATQREIVDAINNCIVVNPPS